MPAIAEVGMAGRGDAVSVEMMALVWQLPDELLYVDAEGEEHKFAVTAIRQHVLLALADHCNEDGRAWPSQRGLAAKCKTSRRTVGETLRAAQQAGILRIMHQGTGKYGGALQTVNTYELLLPPSGGKWLPSDRWEADALPGGKPLPTEPLVQQPSKSNDLSRRDSREGEPPAAAPDIAALVAVDTRLSKKAARRHLAALFAKARQEHVAAVAARIEDAFPDVRADGRYSERGIRFGETDPLAHVAAILEDLRAALREGLSVPEWLQCAGALVNQEAVA